MRWLTVLALFVLLLPSPAEAHRGSLAHLTLSVQERQVTLTLRATRHDLAPALDVSPEVTPLPALYLSKREAVLDNVAAYLTLTTGGGQLCPLQSRSLELEGEQGVLLRLTHRCPRRVELLELRYDLLFDADATHRALVSAPGAPGGGRAVLTGARRVYRLQRQVSPWANAADFLVLGVEHIFTGYDHIAFLLGLLLVASGLRYLLLIVTSFTVAHSLTLALAALGLVGLPSRVVEPAIALSIAYVGLENLLTEAPRRRWLLTFGFGLVHGFGFAHILREIGLPRSGLVLSLLSFNLGVELGQLVVVALAYPLMRLLGRRLGQRRMVRGGSALLLAMGLYWLVERLLGY